MSKIEQLEALGFSRDEILSRVLGGDAKPAVTGLCGVGDKVCIQTCTHYYTGEVVAVSRDAIALEQASWVADTGRFAVFVATGSYNEAEEVGSVRIATGAVVAVLPWKHALPVVTK